MRARAAARKALAATAYARAVLGIARWLAYLDPVPAPGTRQSLPELADHVLRKRHKRVREGAERIAKLDAAARHALRIDVKRLRYGVEGFASLLKGHGKHRYRATLAELQEALGRANDAATARRLLRSLSPPAALAVCADRCLEALVQGGGLHLGKLARRVPRHPPRID
jgi:triphosphatase